jgi:hypothetical protein
MELKIEFIDSAFRHGYGAGDIRHAIQTKIYDAPMVGYSNKYVLLGFNSEGNLLEIGYNPVDDYTISVFHAMKCRKSFHAILGL